MVEEGSEGSGRDGERGARQQGRDRGAGVALLRQSGWTGPLRGQARVRTQPHTAAATCTPRTPAKSLHAARRCADPSPSLLLVLPRRPEALTAPAACPPPPLPKVAQVGQEAAPGSGGGAVIFNTSTVTANPTNHMLAAPKTMVNTVANAWSKVGGRAGGLVAGQAGRQACMRMMRARVHPAGRAAGGL